MFLDLIINRELKSCKSTQHNEEENKKLIKTDNSKSKSVGAKGNLMLIRFANMHFFAYLSCFSHDMSNIMDL